MENNRNHFGNGYAMILRDERSGSVTLWPMEPSCIRIEIEQGKDLSELRDITYVYTSPNNGQSFRLRSDEVLHVKTSTVFFGLVGLSVQDKLKMSLDGAAMSQEMLNKLYKNNFVPKAAVQFDTASMVNEDYESAYLRTLQNYADGKGEGGSSFIPLSPGTNIIPLNIKLTDGQFLELRKYTALQIAAAFGIKPNHLNDYERSSYANSETQQLAFYTDTMLYILKQYEEELNYKLLSQAQREQGYRFKFNIAAVLRGDTKSQLESLSMGVSNGVYTPNEARRNLDLPALPGGDRIYFNGSNIAVEDAGIQYREQEQSDNEKALIRLAESIEKAVECGIMNINKGWVTINGRRVYIGEDGGTGASAKGANKFVRGFKNKQALNNHWQNGRTHKEEYEKDGIVTKEQYEARALELAQSPCSENILGYINAQNEIVRYDVLKNDFVKGNPNRNIKTLFKPKWKEVKSGDKDAGLRYFKEQLAKEGVENDG